MATNKFGTSFKSAVNRGTPAPVAVQNIVSKTKNATPSKVWNNLLSNDYVQRRKVSGSYIYFSNFKPTKRVSGSNFKNETFQTIVNWAIATGYCTPEQVGALKTQKDFFNFFGPFIASQFNWTVKSGWTKSQVKSFGPKTKSTTTKRKRRNTNKTSTKKSTKTSTRKSTRKSSTSRKRKPATSSRKRSSSKSTKATSYKFPKARSNKGRTYRRAA